MPVERVAPTVDSRVERQILTGMIVDNRFCQCIWPLWREEALQFPYSRVMGRWCKEYYEKYNEAPKRHIEDLFLNNKQSLVNGDVDAVHEFLLSISDEYDGHFNTDYVLDLAERHFRINSLNKLKSDIGSAIVSGNVEQGENLVGQYVKPGLPRSKGGNPITDLDHILQAFTVQQTNALYTFPGALGDMVGTISRGELAAVVGPSGVGKTWWMIMMAVNCAMRGLNVAFFSYEMPLFQIYRRVQQAINGAVKIGGKPEVIVPVWDCEKNQMNDCNKRERICSIGLLNQSGKKPDFENTPAGYVPCSVCRQNNPRQWSLEIWHKMETKPIIDDKMIVDKHRALMKGFGRRIGDLHVMAAPSGQMSVNDVRAYIKNREYYEGVIIDVIITDSADKMRVDGFNEHRHGIYKIWMQHKAMAEEFHAMVLTASHSNTERSGRKVKQGDWAEDIRKLRESDIAFALNNEATKGVYSINMLKKRDDEINLNAAVIVLSCLNIGKPYMSSSWDKRKKRD